MDKVGILCAKDSEMMYEFSRRSLHGLKARSPLSVAFPLFHQYINTNVKKEVEKDRLIIEEAVRAFDAGQPVCDLDLECIFENTKKIDKAFLENLVIPGFSINLRYSDFADIRIQRILHISSAVYALLKKWPDTASFSDAARNAYTGKEFKDMIAEILHLYNLETRMLGNAIRSPFHKTITAWLEALFQSMESAKEALAITYTKKIFGEHIVYA